ncbi:MAG: hypothetical protein KAG06_08855 [Methylococcales bacterium]|nr:hypothetical protein [Methylococcales bacterium]
MIIVHILGYHTCKAEGGWSYIKSESPFLSGSGSNQWLTQGYYFWTDSDYFAHKWGKNSYNDDYAIVKCHMEIENSLVLDLVGSVESQILFKKALDKYRARLNKANPNSKQEPTVQAVIAFLRKVSKQNSGVFPFAAIKAQDTSTKYNINTIPFTGGKEEMITNIQRQQLCLFECYSNLITKKEVIYPEEFKKRCIL